MAPVIEVDVEVFCWLESRVKGFGDTPNAVLRRELKLDGPPGPDGGKVKFGTWGITPGPDALFLKDHVSSLPSGPQHLLSEHPAFLSGGLPDGLARVLNASQTTNPMSLQELAGLRRKRPKTRMSMLVEAGVLEPGQPLYFYNYQKKKVEGIEAFVKGDYIVFEGQERSLSEATKIVMQRLKYDNGSYRGPDFWYTATGHSIRYLWENEMGNARYTGESPTED